MKKNEILDFFINEDYLVDIITDDTVAVEEKNMLCIRFWKY